jgi:hypothetical protein
VRLRQIEHLLAGGKLDESFHWRDGASA